MHTLRRLIPPTGRRTLWAWLLVLMVAAQSLGLMHGIVHGAHPHGHPVPFASIHASPAVEVDSGWLSRLFASHDGAPACRLYDQSSHGDCMPAVPPAPLPALALPRAVDAFEAATPSVAALPARSRGPPALR